jgi:hypothetical protein
MANPKSEIYKLVTTMGTEHKDEGKEGEDADDSASLIEDIPEEGEENATEHEQDGARIPKIDRRASIATMRRASVLSTRAAKREAVRDLSLSRLHLCCKSRRSGLVFYLHSRGSSHFYRWQSHPAVLGRRE